MKKEPVCCYWQIITSRNWSCSVWEEYTYNIDLPLLVYSLNGKYEMNLLNKEELFLN